MLRRTFCQSALAGAAYVVIPACGRGGSNVAGSVGTRIPAVSVDGAELSLETSAITEFAAELDGQLFLESDEGYDAARLVWNGMFQDKQPALVAQCASTDDVRMAVLFARESNLLVSVKCGGHSFPGKCTSDGGLMIDLSPMHTVDVDADAMTARADGGSLLGHLDDAASAYNLLTTTGIVSHTGVGGFTLGGGLGRTDRKMGLAIDNLLEATVVTAAGDIVRTSDTENPELLWGLRGGGGNFGIATEMVYRLHPFNPTVYGGDLYFDLTREFYEFFAEFDQTLADEANVEPLLAAGPDDKPEIHLEVVWCGDHAAGEAALAGLFSAPGFKRGELAPFPYRHIQTRLDGDLGHGLRAYLKSCFISEFTPAIIDILVDFGNRSGPLGYFFQHMGGANARVAPDTTAYANRRVAHNIGMIYAGMDPAQDEAGIAAVREMYAELEPHSAGFYTNLHDDTEQKTWGNYGANYPRLQKLKSKYDPDNFFRLNANIQPG